MAYWLCRRYRRCEYYWTATLLVTIVFLYICLYNVHTEVDQPEDVAGWRSRLESNRIEAAMRDGDSDDAIDGRRLRKAFSDSFKKKFDKGVRTSTEPVASSTTTATGSNSPEQVEHEVIDKMEDKVVTVKDDPIMKMREQVDKMNKDEVVLNEDKFPSFDLVMIVQVHRRTEYLKMLVESLRNARDISKVLLVVSFDYYDEELFSVVDNIDICKVIILL